MEHDRLIAAMLFCFALLSLFEVTPFFVIGLTDGKHCTRCDAETVEQEEIPALGHAYENGLCGVCGAQDPDYVEPEKPNKPNRPGWSNIFDKWFGNWWGDKEEQKCEHSYTSVVTAPTCTDKGYTTYTCSKCSDSYKDTYTNALGHTWDNGVVTEAPTCTKNGVNTYTCETCKNQKTETIKATGHDYEDGIYGSCSTEEPAKPSEPSKPNKPGWFFDWIFGGWWK